MTWLLIGITLTMAASGLVMNLLQRAHGWDRYVPHRFAAPANIRVTEREKRVLFGVNSVLSVGLVYGAALVGTGWLFVEGPVSAWTIVLQASGILLVYDILYYALHRWVFHDKRLMRHVHGLHHRARTPTAEESLFTHPVELVAGLALLMGSTWLVGPVHVVAFCVAFFVYSLLNVVIHSGIAFPGAPLSVLNPWARSHHGHHGVDMNGNYGSLTPIWDRLLGTAIPRERFTR